MVILIFMYVLPSSFPAISAACVNNSFNVVINCNFLMNCRWLCSSGFKRHCRDFLTFRQTIIRAKSDAGDLKTSLVMFCFFYFLFYLLFPVPVTVALQLFDEFLCFWFCDRLNSEESSPPASSHSHCLQWCRIVWHCSAMKTCVMNILYMLIMCMHIHECCLVISLCFLP